MDEPPAVADVRSVDSRRQGMMSPDVPTAGWDSPLAPKALTRS